MERSTIDRLKSLFGNRLIGPDELMPLLSKVGEGSAPVVPELNYSWEELEEAAKDHLLVMGVPTYAGQSLSIRTLRTVFGVDPEVAEPCFYNQDWYLQEPFLDRTLESRWYLLRKEVVETSRAVRPEVLMEEHFAFPSAILCAYTFFACWLQTGEKLWYHDFVWCEDVDHNGDRIYVGKYHDVDGVNKNGFSVHRHLALRACYAAVTTK